MNQNYCTCADDNITAEGTKTTWINKCCTASKPSGLSDSNYTSYCCNGDGSGLTKRTTATTQHALCCSTNTSTPTQYCCQNNQPGAGSSYCCTQYNIQEYCTGCALSATNLHTMYNTTDCCYNTTVLNNLSNSTLLSNWKSGCCTSASTLSNLASNTTLKNAWVANCCNESSVKNSTVTNVQNAYNSYCDSCELRLANGGTLNETVNGVNCCEALKSNISNATYRTQCCGAINT